MQRRLQRSVSETRRSVATRPCRSTSPPVPGTRVGTAQHRVGQRARRGHPPNVVPERGNAVGRGDSAARLARATRETGGAPPALACGQEARENPCHPARSSVRTSGSSPSPARRAFSFAGWLARLPDAHPRPRGGAARRGRDRQLRPGRRRRRHARPGHLAGQPAVGPRHGPARPGRRPAAGLHRLPGLRGRLRRRRGPGRPAVVVVRARRADRGLRPERRLGRPGPLGRRAGRRRPADGVRLRVGGRRGRVRRRAAARHAARHADQPAGRLPHRCGHRLLRRDVAVPAAGHRAAGAARGRRRRPAALGRC